MALKTICFLLFSESETGTYHFKLLVPSVAAGAIIGKGGETIAQLQREKHAKVKMSKANDFYPGTEFLMIDTLGFEKFSFFGLLVWFIRTFSKIQR